MINIDLLWINGKQNTNFLLTFIKVTHKHIFCDIFIKIKEMVVIKNNFS
jgi:hypothetical protein